jgi:hypothetical protein
MLSIKSSATVRSAVGGKPTQSNSCHTFRMQFQQLVRELA